MTETIQQARTDAAQEVAQLQDTARSLRDELERIKFNFADEMQNRDRSAGEELSQLRATIVALRQQLDRADDK
jgi:hypothetical protein